MKLLSVNRGRAAASAHTGQPEGLTGIGKRPAEGPVEVRDPGPSGTGGSGLVGDDVCDLRHHGGTRQAVYAYAREELDHWEAELERPLRNGEFGENFTTLGLDVNGALLGERWRVGPDLVLEVTASRIPCRTFAGALDEKQWVKRFTAAAVPGAYLKVVQPGSVRAGDAIAVLHRPAHEVTVATHFRAHTLERDLLPRLLEAGDVLSPYTREKALAHLDKHGSVARAGN
ncbi:MOSC domain-containing protein [Streptomyces candidus]|uniref:MOSC domain-containing protein YiiM n=1 Tax=Streptomyces candidus TaxID=67283 RepID=A0A7X0LNK7_9ACTN|nr:MOSC domain-containing protein [Streptomyces candidus]MBB6434967.1 MOSC domain-containing protein YiiM [Streptomyces candidus]GHH41197.1 sulfurase [Streptomyces candidus]